MLKKIKQHHFVFSELVKRDFTRKYKRTVIGIGWSVLAPLLQLLVTAMIFGVFFGRDTPHFIIYLFSGQVILSFFKDSTTEGMTSLKANAGIISKINIPKYIFLLSKNVTALINFIIILIIYFIFVFCDGIAPSWNFFLIIYPIFCLILLNLGVGLILSVFFVFFQDIQYLYNIFTQLLTYVSAIFYTVDHFSPTMQNVFYLNPIYVYITYIRTIVIDGTIPSVEVHILCIVYALIALLLGALLYKKQNYKFIYYI